MSVDSQFFDFLPHMDRHQTSAPHGPSAEILLRQAAARQDLLGADEEHEKQSKGHARVSSDPVPIVRNTLGNLEDSSLEELQEHALDKSEETTSTIHNCLMVAEDMRQEATKTIVQLHEQGEQIRRTHETALVLEQELSKGEKLLSSLGGIFSRAWRPNRAHEITGPVDFHDRIPLHPTVNKIHSEERTKTWNDHKITNSSDTQNQPAQFQSHVQKEKVKQDEALSDLSNVLDQLKEMSMDMGNELQSQNQSLSRLHDDVSELEFRVKNANERGRHLLHR